MELAKLAAMKAVASVPKRNLDGPPADWSIRMLGGLAMQFGLIMGTCCTCYLQAYAAAASSKVK